MARALGAELAQGWLYGRRQLLGGLPTQPGTTGSSRPACGPTRATSRPTACSAPTPPRAAAARPSSARWPAT